MTHGFAAFAITRCQPRCISNASPPLEARGATDIANIDARLAAVSPRPCHRQFIHRPEYLSSSALSPADSIHFPISRAIKLSLSLFFETRMSRCPSHIFIVSDDNEKYTCIRILRVESVDGFNSPFGYSNDFLKPHPSIFYPFHSHMWSPLRRVSHSKSFRRVN